jgi:ubiquinone/menaquinone biosynthesis C-methylase UbiE
MKMLRKLYYALSPQLRFQARRLYYAPSDFFEKIKNKNEAIVPPKGLIFTGSGDFLNQGKQYLQLFQQYGGLKPQHHVLDVGSGIGRMAIPLTRFLDKTARYEGFDVVEMGVEWCQNNISTLYPNFKFTYIPLKNDLYTENGDAAEQFVFPYADNSFDFCFLTSVFTHLLPEQVENYLREIRRVLKPRGVCFATFFILNEKATPSSNPEFVFPFDYGHYFLMNDKVKSANVAFQQDYLEAFTKKIEFPIKAFHFGYWSHQQKSTALDFQDIVIFEKK